MKFIIHQPRVEVREYDLPMLPEATDRQVLAQAATATPVSVSVVDMGSPRVHMRGGDEVTQAGQRLNEARVAQAHAWEEAKHVALAALEDGTMSERAVAEALGVDRNTVRAWQGKTGTTAKTNGLAPGIIAAREQQAAGLNTR